MRLIILAVLAVLGSNIIVNAAYDFIIEDGYLEGITLNDHQFLLMTGGGMHDLSLYDYSKVKIQGTDSLKEHSGGIWWLNMGGYSRLEFSGGEVYQFDIILLKCILCFG